ncbi:hypothetical protein CROQUDRAFT_88508 [Cronartium quercuum f. sp. fusiforme G11]|uniref:Uncharacterized protein n=1 Tax=Cronartium quercuum f. sp. fusiforme G11 TaxID=708437 RepID=A0A9P6NUY7_9BASI|nr:hypothetical protein CROQUDRAFT_88508 [Cronartium quercuum f. sp. fusiforme G11]
MGDVKRLTSTPRRCPPPPPPPPPALFDSSKQRDLETRFHLYISFHPHFHRSIPVSKA